MDKGCRRMNAELESVENTVLQSHTPGRGHQFRCISTGCFNMLISLTLCQPITGMNWLAVACRKT